MPDQMVLDTSDRKIQQANRRQGQRKVRRATHMSKAPGSVARSVTQRNVSYSGKGMLTAELLVGFMLIAIRVVANYEVQQGGQVKGKILHPKGEYGPLSVFSGLIMTFFILSFLAAAGGLKAKMAVIIGGSIVLTLAVHTLDDIKTVSTTLGQMGQITVPDPTGAEVSVLGSQAEATTPAAPAAPAPSSTQTPAQKASGAPSAADQQAASNSFSAGNRAIGSIKSPFTQNILHGDITGIPGTVASDAANLGKAISDYVNGLIHGAGSAPQSNITPQPDAIPGHPGGK